jgi:hypothetical protein
MAKSRFINSPTSANLPLPNQYLAICKGGFMSILRGYLNEPGVSHDLEGTPRTSYSVQGHRTTTGQTSRPAFFKRQQKDAS